MLEAAAAKGIEVYVLDPKGTLLYRGRIDETHDDPKNVKSPDLRNALDAILARGTEHPERGSASAWTRDAVIYPGVGTGMRWASPMGPLELDVAYGTRTRSATLAAATDDGDKVLRHEPHHARGVTADEHEHAQRARKDYGKGQRNNDVAK